MGKKIAFIVEELNSGGIGTICKLLANELANHGMQVTIICLQHERQTSHVISTTYVVHYLDPNKDSSIQLMEFLRDNPHDCVASHDVPRMSATFRAIKANAVHILWLHDSFRKNINFAMQNLDNCDAVVCVADHILRKLQENLKDFSTIPPLRRLHNGVRIQNAEIRTLRTDPVDLFFMGNTDPIKGVYDIIPLLKETKRRGLNVRVSVAGNVSLDMQREVKRWGFEKDFVWLGWVSNEKCLEIARDSAFFLMLSRKEAFGMVTTEAMSIGCVPIAYDCVSGSQEIIDHLKDGFLVPFGRFDQIADCVDLFLQQRDKYDALSEQAIVKVERNFSMEVTAANFMDFLAELPMRDRVGEMELTMPAATRASPLGQLKAFLRSFYQYFPFRMRSWVRFQVCKYPKLCRWILDKWY